MQQQPTIIFFDGLCHLCNGFVDFIIQKDLKRHFQYAPLQGDTAKKLLTESDRTSLESVILLANQKKYFRSDAVLKVLCSLGGVYAVFGLGYLLPTALRDAIYNWVAKNRYAWFGKREFCRLPEAHEKDRLLP